MPHVPNLIVTVDGAVTVHGRDLVLIRRAKPPFENVLVLPGGHVEPEDVTLAQACARELSEEINLSVEPDRLAFLVLLNRPDADERYDRRLSVVYRVDITDAELDRMRAGSDAAALEIVPVSSLTPDRVGFDHFEAVLALRARMEEES